MLRPVAVSVVPEDDFIILLTFDSGEKGRFDVKPYIKGDFFGKLSDKSYFDRVFTNGYSVEWPDGQDLCPDEIYYNSIKS